MLLFLPLFDDIVFFLNLFHLHAEKEETSVADTFRDYVDASTTFLYYLFDDC